METFDYLKDKTENVLDMQDNNNTEQTNYYTNDVPNDELILIRETIQKMNKFNQIEILRILQKCKDVTLWENKYGIHVNLPEVKNEIIDEIKVYINYVNAQEMTLYQIEEEKEKFKNIYFTKDNKDIKTNNVKFNEDSFS
jgi:hypothetical protein